MKKFDVYAIGNALVDIEYHASEAQICSLDIDKGVMTLVLPKSPAAKPKQKKISITSK